MSATAAFKLIGEVQHPTEKCRGCGGIGVGIQVSPRSMQLLEVEGRGFRLIHPDSSKRERYVRLAPHLLRKQGVYHGPLAIILTVLDELHAEGFEVDPLKPIPFGKSWACEWCHGTGQPQLSAHALEVALEQSGQE